MELRGHEFVDLASYVRGVTERTYPASVVLESTCGCRATAFRVEVDSDAGSARRTCLECGRSAFIGDSEEFWSEAEAEPVRCNCGGEAFEVGVGYSLDEEQEVNWLTVGCRCLNCGAMLIGAEWRIDYTPTEHLFEKA
jgi:hypothetical protein